MIIGSDWRYITDVGNEPGLGGGEMNSGGVTEELLPLFKAFGVFRKQKPEQEFSFFSNVIFHHFAGSYI